MYLMWLVKACMVIHAFSNIIIIIIIIVIIIIIIIIIIIHINYMEHGTKI